MVAHELAQSVKLVQDLIVWVEENPPIISSRVRMEAVLSPPKGRAVNKLS